MAVETFAGATTPSDIVFCDTNFLIDLCIATSQALSSAFAGRPGDIARAAAAVGFFRRYRRDHGTYFISSPLVLEELVHKLQTCVLKGTGYSKWKDLKRGNGAAFAQRRAALSSILDELETTLEQYELTFVVPRHGAASTAYCPADDVCDMALHFYQVYDTLDPMDAVHVSMALASGARWLASSDEDLTSVAEINFFTGLR